MPTIEISSQTGKDFSGDVLIVPVFSGRERHRLPLAISKVARQVMDENDFKADYLEVVPLHHPNGVKDSRWMLLVGLGEEESVTHNKIRKAVGTAARKALKKGWKRVGVGLPLHLLPGPRRGPGGGAGRRPPGRLRFRRLQGQPRAPALRAGGSVHQRRRHPQGPPPAAPGGSRGGRLPPGARPGQHPRRATCTPRRSPPRPRSWPSSTSWAIEVLGPEELAEGQLQRRAGRGQGLRPHPPGGEAGIQAQGEGQAPHRPGGQGRDLRFRRPVPEGRRRHGDHEGRYDRRRHRPGDPGGLRPGGSAGGGHRPHGPGGEHARPAPPTSPAT